MGVGFAPDLTRCQAAPAVEQGTRRTRTDALPDRAPLDQHIAALLELIALDDRATAVALHGFRSCLHDIQLAINAELLILPVTLPDIWNCLKKK